MGSQSDQHNLQRLCMFIHNRDLITRFPYAVNHGISWTSPEWWIMREWLDTHVGPRDIAWSWLIPSEVRFANESDSFNF